MTNLDLLTTAEAAEILQVLPATVHNYVTKRKLRVYKIGVGNRDLFRREEVEALLEPKPKRRRRRSS